MFVPRVPIEVQGITLEFYGPTATDYAWWDSLQPDYLRAVETGEKSDVPGKVHEKLLELCCGARIGSGDLPDDWKDQLRESALLRRNWEVVGHQLFFRGDETARVVGYA
jgi:hypothetical protein